MARPAAVLFGCRRRDVDEDRAEEWHGGGCGDSSLVPMEVESGMDMEKSSIVDGLAGVHQGAAEVGCHSNRKNGQRHWVGGGRGPRRWGGGIVEEAEAGEVEGVTGSGGAVRAERFLAWKE